MSASNKAQHWNCCCCGNDKLFHRFRNKWNLVDAFHKGFNFLVICNHIIPAILHFKFLMFLIFQKFILRKSETIFYPKFMMVFTETPLNGSWMKMCSLSYSSFNICESSPPNLDSFKEYYEYCIYYVCVMEEKLGKYPKTTKDLEFCPVSFKCILFLVFSAP